MHDVIIAGGGLAGLTLGLQLRLQLPQTSVAILERGTFPVREAAHKVGESTVEVGALYLADVLGLRELLDETHAGKYGLRFFFSDGANDDIAQRSEFGLSEFMPLRTWQVDRGRLENQLAARFVAAGGTLYEGAKVRDVDLSTGGHTVSFDDPRGSHTLCGRWVVDASGRRALLKKQLKLAKRMRHKASAAWWRIPGVVDPDTWSSNPDYGRFTTTPRLLSTVHMMGDNYWVWVIALPSGGTSIGIVAVEPAHDFSAFRSADAADAWLEEHEPQLAKALKSAGPRQDFLALKHFTHGATRVFSPDRWALAGDAGLFLDPFYSPGTDFIGMSNTMLVDAISADLRGDPDAAERIEAQNARMLIMYRAYLGTWLGKYPLMGRPEVMQAKLVWDFSFYWGSYALIFSQGRTGDVEFARRTEPLFHDLIRLNVDMQSLLSRWGRVAPRHPAVPTRVDYRAPAWLCALNDALRHPVDDLVAALYANRAHLLELAAELQQRALARDPSLDRMVTELPAPGGELTAFLDGVPITTRGAE